MVVLKQIYRLSLILMPVELQKVMLQFLLIPKLNIDTAEVTGKVKNPLSELSKVLGDNWSKARFELGASIPVFPEFFAIFGLFIEFVAKLPDTIDASLSYSEDDGLSVTVGTEMDAKIKSGIFSGVQAGHPLVLSLALLLQAVAVLQNKFSLAYTKIFL